MSEVTNLDIYLAERVFQVYRARDDGSVVVCKTLSPGQVSAFFVQPPR